MISSAAPKESHMQSFESSVTFSADEDSGVSLRNFWATEDGFVWSTGRWCEITFAFDNGGRPPLLADLIIDVDAFRHAPKLEGQNALLYLNGLRIASFYVLRRTTYYASFDPRQLKSADNVLTIDTPDVACPRDFGSDDGRLLGIKLFSLQIRKSG
jgi:hypothetical protein